MDRAFRASVFAGALALLVVLSGCLACLQEFRAGAHLPVREVHSWRAIYKPLRGELFAAGGPSPYDVEQGEVGTCWLLSAMAATAQQQPQRIRRMFRSQGQDVFKVTFASPGGYSSEDSGQGQVGAGDLSVTITSEVPHWCFAGAPIYAHSARGNWVSLLEKAYASKFAPQQGYEGIGGDHPRIALGYLTGWGVEDYDIDGDLSGPGEDQEWAHLLSAYHAGAPMVAGSRIFQPREEVVPMHAYAVTGMHQDERGNRFVRLFDPEGLNSQPNHEITLSIDQFNDYFYYVSIARPPTTESTQ